MNIFHDLCNQILTPNLSPPLLSSVLCVVVVEYVFVFAHDVCPWFVQSITPHQTSPQSPALLMISDDCAFVLVCCLVTSSRALRFLRNYGDEGTQLCLCMHLCVS